MRAFAMSTRGAHSCVRNTPTGLPDCTSRVSSDRRRESVARMRSKADHERAARPVAPYTMRSSGRSATSGSRLFWIIRKAASCGQARQCKELPRGARTTRAVMVTLSIVRLAAVHAIRTDLRDQGGVPRQRRDQALLERRLFDQLQPVLHEDPAQIDLVGESCRLRWRVRRRDAVEVAARKSGTTVA